MHVVQLEDHQAEISALNDALCIDPVRTAIVTVDMHRGHLDPVEATLPVAEEESRRVCSNAYTLLAFARSQNIPIIHVIAAFRELELIKMNPRLEANKRITLSKSTSKTDAQNRGDLHNIVGSVQTELMPEIGPEKGDYVIDNKKTFSSFMGTELEHLLRVVLQVDTVVLMGINTNTCVLCAAFEAFNYGYTTIVISDCVASMYGQDLHELALQNISRCLGWVLTLDQFIHKIKEG